jgi:1-phosphofructokinase
VAALGVRFAVDTSGQALTAALRGLPALVKPNRDELAESVGFRIDTLGDAVRAAEAMRSAGAVSVLASLGADGAVVVDRDGVRYGESPVDHGRSAVGAGDAMLAGYLAAGVAGGDLLVEALSWGAAAVRFPGSRMPGPSDVERGAVVVHATADPSRPLSGPQQAHGMEQIR